MKYYENGCSKLSSKQFRYASITASLLLELKGNLGLNLY